MFSHIIPSTELDITDLLYNCEGHVNIIHLTCEMNFLNTVFEELFVPISFSQQLQENALSVGSWQSTSVFIVYRIANFSPEESNSTAEPATDR